MSHGVLGTAGTQDLSVHTRLGHPGDHEGCCLTVLFLCIHAVSLWLILTKNPTGRGFWEPEVLWPISHLPEPKGSLEGSAVGLVSVSRHKVQLPQQDCWASTDVIHPCNFLPRSLVGPAFFKELYRNGFDPVFTVRHQQAAKVSEPLSSFLVDPPLLNLITAPPSDKVFCSQAGPNPTV